VPEVLRALLKVIDMAHDESQLEKAQ
jgi:hypothetical protein